MTFWDVRARRRDTFQNRRAPECREVGLLHGLQLLLQVRAHRKPGRLVDVHPWSNDGSSNPVASSLTWYKSASAFFATMVSGIVGIGIYMGFFVLPVLLTFFVPLTRAQKKDVEPTSKGVPAVSGSSNNSTVVA